MRPFVIVGYRVVLCLVASALCCSCVDRQAAFDACVPPEGKYDVRILRDEWGVPHVYGKTDADVAYGLAYAHCEDDFETIQEGYFLGTGQMGLRNGRDGAPMDYLVKLFRFREIVTERYDSDLSPETKALCEAYAYGCNHYAALHPEERAEGLRPVSGVDVVTGFVMKVPMFFGMDGEVRRLFQDKRARSLSEKVAYNWAALAEEPLVTGSNTFAVAPSRTPDGKTHLAINSHQPWTGPVAWYEARLLSEEGYDIVGGVFPGTPVVLHGHNRDLGWAHTVNRPDLVDIYVLEMNPDNPNQYRFDGEWRDLEVREIPITVRLWGSIRWTFKREALYSVHGPAVRQPHGVYAIRYAGYGDIRQVEQWFRMGKSRNREEFESAMRMQAIPSFNVGYADKEGNIWYIYNALFPKRAEGYDWSQYVPGNTSETLWEDYVPFDGIPQVLNPPSGFVQNCNSTPYLTTVGAGNPRVEDFSVTLGVEPLEVMTNRAIRARELFGADESITEEEFYAYKYDMRYAFSALVGDSRQSILDKTPTDDPLVAEALEVMRAWDGGAEPENTHTALGVLALEPVVRARLFGNTPPDPVETFIEKARTLHEVFGRLEVPWHEVNRLVHGKTNLGLGGGPDTLHAVYGQWNGKHLVGKAGDCYVLMATWDEAGKVHSRSIHQFGSATMDETSPHYCDQAPLFAARKTKPVWLDEAELRAHLESEYRPGEARPKPWVSQ